MNQKSPGAPQPQSLRCALYARVSTSDQNNALQIAELTAFLARRGWTPAGIYQDTLSGARASRPGLERLLADARRGRFEAVAVWKLDRFGRSLLDCLAGIQELSALGIRFLAITQSIDTDQSNPTSKLLLQLLAAVAEFERELMRERVVAGMRSARANGKHCGRPRRVVDRIELVRLREQGLSWAEVAGRLGVGVGKGFGQSDSRLKPPGVAWESARTEVAHVFSHVYFSSVRFRRALCALVRGGGQSLNSLPDPVDRGLAICELLHRSQVIEPGGPGKSVPDFGQPAGRPVGRKPRQFLL